MKKIKIKLSQNSKIILLKKQSVHLEQMNTNKVMRFLYF